jgi:probable HAF family extracellular repeat protein
MVGDGNFIGMTSRAPYVWNPTTGFTVIPTLNGFDFGQAVSADGTIAVGQYDGGPNLAFQWNQQTVEFLSLPRLPGGFGNSHAYGNSADGSVVVGWSDGPNGVEAFRWTSATGSIGLGDIPGGPFSSVARGISADGTVVVGYGKNASNLDEAFRWTESGLVSLGDLPDGTLSSRALAISGNGLVIAGQGTSGAGNEAFRWENNDFTGLGDLPGGTFLSQANALSADGSVLVGLGTTSEGNRAFIWDSASGMQNLHEVLVEQFGLDLGGVILNEATGISADGSVIVGNGASGNFQIAWRAVIPEPSACILLGLAACSTRRRSQRFFTSCDNNHGGQPGPP